MPSRIMVGLIKISRLVLTVSLLVERNSDPKTGISPRIGTLDSDSNAFSCIMPPSAIMLPSFTNTAVFSSRLSKRISTAP